MAVSETRQQALREWFGSSQLVGNGGEPLVLYHGTNADLKSFRPELSRGDVGAGSYFTTDRELANSQASSVEGANVMPVYVKIENPVPEKVLQRIVDRYKQSGDDWTPQDISDEVEQMGYDGVILRHGDGIMAVAYQSTQIKSALGNFGVFDPLSSDIRHSLAEPVLEAATPDSVRAAISHLVRVPADELAEGLGNIVVATSEEVASALVQRHRDAAFQAWFGDSKVVGAGGAPLTVYHGTGVEFSVFKDNQDGGHYFTPSRETAEWFAHAGDKGWHDEWNSRVEVVHLAIKNPRVLDYDGLFNAIGIDEKDERDPNSIDWTSMPSLIEEAKREGYDGLHLIGMPEYNGEIADQWVAFSPEQIKSAVGNRGTYDPNDPDIRHSLAGLDDRAQAWHDAGTNTTVFLADRIAAGQEAAVFLHETVHRHGRQALPEGRWDALVGQVKAWAQAEPQSPERVIHDAAAARVATAGVAGALADEELFAYAVEEAVARGIEPSAAAVEGSAEAWLQAVVESIQRISDKLLGNDLQGLGGQDLVDLAYALAQLDSPEHGVEVRRALREEAVARAEADLPIVSDVYGEQIQVDGAWFHAERIFGRPASTYRIGDAVPQLSEKKLARKDEPDEVVSSDLFRESGANITNDGKVEKYAQAMSEYGGWGDFPPCVGRVEVVSGADVDRYEEMAESGTAHELGFSRPLERKDVGRRYIHLENGHHRSHAAHQSGLDIPVFDLNVQERGRDFIGFDEGPTP